MKSLRMFEDPEKIDSFMNFTLEKLSSTVENKDFALKKSEAEKKPVEKRVSGLKTTNLLMSRKKCEKKAYNIDDVVSSDVKILSFGQFISGQNLGNVIELTNKTNEV